MNRIDHSTATADKKFTEGSPAAAVPATVVTAKWLNTIQEELAHLVATAGLTLNAQDDTQLRQAVQALIAAALPTYTTPPQFDSDLSGATTEFVQRALGNDAGVVALSGATVLDYSYLGHQIQCAGTTYPVTLPDAAGCARGSRINLLGFGSGPYTITPASGQDIIAPIATDPLATLSLGSGETLILESWGSSHWYIVGGSAALRWASGFRASLGNSGYQRLPSGLIMQWGSAYADSAGKATITYPLAFSDRTYAPVVSLNSPGLTANCLAVASGTQTGLLIYAATSAGVAIPNALVFFFVVGK